MKTIARTWTCWPSTPFLFLKPMAFYLIWIVLKLGRDIRLRFLQALYFLWCFLYIEKKQKESGRYKCKDLIGRGFFFFFFFKFVFDIENGKYRNCFYKRLKNERKGVAWDWDPLSLCLFTGAHPLWHGTQALPFE